MCVCVLFPDAGRFMSFQNYYVDSPDIQETLRVYDLIREQNTVSHMTKNTIITCTKMNLK